MLRPIVTLYSPTLMSMIAGVLTEDIDSQTDYLIDTMLVRPISTKNFNIYLIKVSIKILTPILSRISKLPSSCCLHPHGGRQTHC